MIVKMRKVKKTKKVMTTKISVWTESSFKFCWVSIIVRHDMYHVHEFCVLFSYHYVFTHNPNFIFRFRSLIYRNLSQIKWYDNAIKL